MSRVNQKYFLNRHVVHRFLPVLKKRLKWKASMSMTKVYQLRRYKLNKNTIPTPMTYKAIIFMKILLKKIAKF